MVFDTFKAYYVIVKGVVLFGIDPNIITLRKVKYTIGLSVRENWDEIKYKEGEFWDDYQNVNNFSNCFDAFIKIGENIPIGKIIKQVNPILTSDEGFDYLRKVSLDLGKDYPIGKIIKLQLKFGETFTEAKYVHEKSKIKTNNLPLYFEKWII